MRFKNNQNHKIFLEEAIHNATTSNNDVHYDRIIPYMMSVDPMFIFADSEGTIPLPEFYEEYPIYVAPDKYDDLKEEYHSIYKIYDGGSATIQLFPSSSPHKIASDIVMFEAYLVDSLGNERPLGNFVDNHEYNNLTGEVTLTSDYDINTFTSLINSWEGDNKNVADYDAYIILDFKIEKFRDITNAGSLSTEEVNRIATMQSVQASVLEYIYQFSIAQSTQERLNEIAYTAFLTSITTVISLAVSYGYSAIASKISSSMMSPWISAEKGVSDIFYQNLAKDLFGLTSAATKTTSTLGNIFKVAKAVIAVGSEVVEELLVDPWIEAYVSNMVAKAGGDVYEQIWWSTLAESGRESGLSIATTTIQQLVMPSQTQVSGNLHATYQSSLFDLHQMQADMRTQQESMTGEIIETAVASILLLLGAVGGGVFGSAGASLGNIMIGFGTSVEGISSIKDVFETALLRRQYSKDFYSIPFGEVFHSKVSDPVTQAIYDEIDDNVGDALGFSTLKSSQKPPPSQRAVEEVKEITSTDTNKIIDWISRHKKGLAIAGYGVAGVVGAIFPAVGAILSAIPTLTIGMSNIDVQPSQAKILLLELYNIRFGTQLQSLNIITDTQRKLFGESVGLSKRAILSYIKGERIKLELESLSKIYKGVNQWGDNEIALSAIRRFARDIGVKFQLAYDLSTVLYEYSKKIFKPREIASILGISYDKFRSTFLRKDRQVSPMDRENIMEYLYRIHKINLGHINQFLPASRHISLSDLNNIKRQSISYFTNYVFDNGILPEEMKNKFEMLRNIVFAISDSRGELISLKELSEMIDRNQKYLVDSLKRRPDMSFDDLSSLYDVLTKKELAQMLAPNIYSILQGDYFKYVDYSVRYDKRFAQFYDNALNLIIQGVRVENTYPKLFTDNTKTIELQREILYKFQGGRDLLTGERINFEDLAKTDRHHWRTSNPFNKLDCRIRALVLLTDSNHATVTHSSDKRHYEDLFIQAIESLLEGEPPSHWSDVVKSEFRAENPNGLNYKGIKYLFLY